MSPGPAAARGHAGARGSGRGAARARRCAGYTLVELMVGSTLASVFAIAMAGTSSLFFDLLKDLGQRTYNLRDADVVRARMIADAKGAEDATCSDGSTLLFTFGGGGPVSQVQYTASEGDLLRWISATDREVSLVSGVDALACTDLGPRGVEVDVAMGGDVHPLHVYLHVAESPGGGPP